MSGRDRGRLNGWMDDLVGDPIVDDLRALIASHKALVEALVLASHRTPPYSKETQAKIDAALKQAGALWLCRKHHAEHHSKAAGEK